MALERDRYLNTNRLMNVANRTARVLLFCLTLALALSFSISKVEERDFGWLLKTGQYICESRSVPRADVYSYTAAGNKYIDSHWLYQVLLFTSYRLLGIVGPTLLTATLVTATFSFVYSIGYEKRKYAITAALTAAGIIIASERFLVRPHIVTLFFLSSYFLILERHRESGTRLILLLPPLQALWVNMHGLFVMGIVLPAAYLAFALIEGKVRLPEKWKGGQALAGKAPRLLLLLFLIMLAESLLNPYTTDLALYPLTLFKEIHSGASVVATSVGELAPPLTSGDLSRSEKLFVCMMFISAFSFLLNLKRLNLTHLTLFAAFLYLAVTARRNLDLFSVVAVPITVMNFNRFLDDVIARFKRLNAEHAFEVVQLAVSPFMIAGFIYLISQVVTSRYYISDKDLTRFGFGVARHAYPIKAANFVEASNLGGQMFNEPSDGGYLIWRFYPERKVFFDGRWEVYGEAFVENFRLLCSDPVRFEEYSAANDIRYAILPHSIPHEQRLIRYMTDSPLWKPVYFDEVAVLFIRNIPEHAGVIDKFKIDFATFEAIRDKFEEQLPKGIENSHFDGMDSVLVRLTERLTPKQDYVFSEIAEAKFYLALGNYEGARLLYEKAVRICPDSYMARAGLGAVYFDQKQYLPALAEFEAAEKLAPRSGANLMNLANTNLVIGNFEKAEEYYKSARRFAPRNAAASLQLGKLYAHSGRTKEAIRELERALKLDPGMYEASELLRQIQGIN